MSSRSRGFRAARRASSVPSQPVDIGGGTMDTPVQSDFLDRVSGVQIAARTVTAWTALSGASRGMALIAAVAAIVSTSSSRVPVASGAAICVLIVAAVIDTREHRLPNVLVGSAAILFVTALGVELVLDATSGNPPASSLVRSAALGSLTFAAPLAALHLISPTSMGFGDVKAGFVLGAATGVVDWQLALAALTLAAGLTAAAGIVRGVRAIAFGPGLAAGCVLALCIHPLLLDVPDARHDAPQHERAAHS